MSSSRRKKSSPSAETASASPVAPSGRSPVIPLVAFAAGAMLAGVTTWTLARRAEPASTPATTPPPPAAPASAQRALGASFEGKPGPWGLLEYTPIEIAPPQDLVKVDGDITPVHWIFPGYTRAKVEEMLGEVGLSPAQLSALANAWSVKPDGVVITPPPAVILELDPAVRTALYSVLARHPENVHNAALAFRADELETRLARSDLAPATIALLRKLLYRRGDYVFFADDRTLLPMLPDHQERTRLVILLARQQTYAVRLKLDGRSNLPQLLQYWGRPGRSKDIEPILRSLMAVPGGYALDLAHLLPPIPRRRIFTYPRPGKSGDETKNCHWTSLNFAAEIADDRFLDAGQAAKEVAARYQQVQEPTFGDLVILLDRQTGTVVHSAAYLADDVVFTKNGFGLVEPWIYMPLDRMVEVYTTLLGRSEPVEVLLYRRHRPRS